MMYNRKSSDGSLSGVMQKWKEYQLQCLKYLYETPPIVAEGKFCNRTFDNYACWPDGLPGTYVNVSCPWYLPWANAAPYMEFEIDSKTAELPSLHLMKMEKMTLFGKYLQNMFI
ncbi:hypothetical protein Q9966_004578 [Columba livia]|nr:hypothetical protein Q9966_004578 [Columba livia]